jgi:hypothetical protein
LKFISGLHLTTDSNSRYIKKLDLEMQVQDRQVVLLDNFSGHFIEYKPSNIELVYFTPNITSHIQPLNAGIIRCFKAYYQWLFCKRAMDKDDLGKENIHKINLLKAMTMAEQAWKMVSADTIRNCW